MKIVVVLKYVIILLVSLSFGWAIEAVRIRCMVYNYRWGQAKPFEVIGLIRRHACGKAAVAVVCQNGTNNWFPGQ